MLQLIHAELARVFGIKYRIAYATGVEMEIGKERLSGWAHQGEALLYNPERMINLTPNDVTVISPTLSLPHVVRGIGSPAVNDERTLDYNERGTHLRASVPVCNSKYEAFARAFLDGPEMEMRNPGAGPFYTNCVGPIGPAWNFQYDPLTGRWRRIGAFNRMALKTDPDHALEFYNVHLTQNERTGDGISVIDQTLSSVRQFVSHPKGAARPPLHTAPIFANDINVNFGDGGFNFLLRELDDWRVLEWGPGLASVQAPNPPQDYIDTMGVLQANLDPNLGPVYQDQPVLYPSVMVNSAWLPQGVSDPSIAPKGADLRFYTGPGLVFTDHTSQRFTLKTVEEQDVLPGFMQEWLRGVDLYDRGFVTTTFVWECAASDQCRDWLCKDLGACD